MEVEMEASSAHYDSTANEQQLGQVSEKPVLLIPYDLQTAFLPHIYGDSDT